MNRRTLKKHCQRAMAILVKEHRYPRDAFAPSYGEEAVGAPPTMERRFVRSGFLDPGPLKGTMMLWQRTNCECEEWDCRLPSEELKDVEFWSGLSDEDYRKMCEAE